MDSNFEFLLQMGIDVGNSLAEWEAAYKAMRATMSKPIEVPIKPEMDLKGLKTQIESVTKELDEVTTSLKAVEHQMGEVEEQTKEAAQAVEKLMPKAAEQVERAFEKSGTAAKDAIEGILAEFKKLKGVSVNPQELLLGAAGGNQRRAIDIAKQAQSLLRYNTAYRDLKRQRRALEASGASDSDKQRADELLADARKERNRQARSFSERVGHTGLARTIYHQLRQFTQTGGAAAVDDSDLRGALEGLVGSLGRGASLRQGVAGQRARQSELVQLLHGYAEHAKTLSAAGAAVGAGPGGGGIHVGVDIAALEKQLAAHKFRLLIDVEHIHEQMQSHFTSHPFKLQIDLSHLEQELAGKLPGTSASLVETMQAIATSVGNAAAAMKASGITDPAYLRQRRDEDRAVARQDAVQRRREERGGQVSKKQTRRIAKEDPLTFLGTYAPELIPHAKKILGVYDDNLSLDERGRRSKEALDVIPQFIKAINDKEGAAGLTEGQKEHFKVFGESFAAKYITNLEARARAVRDFGPRSNPTGALAGVDHNAAEIAKAEYAKAVAALKQQIGGFGATRMDFGQESYRDRTAEKAKAYRDLLNQMVKWENAVVTLQDARDEKEQLIAKKRVEAAQQDYKFSEQILRNRLLADQKGQIETPLFDPTKGEFAGKASLGYAGAASVIAAGLQQALGSTLSGINGGRLAQNQPGLNMSGLLNGLFSSNPSAEVKNLQREFLKLKGVADDVLADDTKMAAELEKQLAPLRDVYKVHQQIEGVMEREVANIHKQEEQQKKLAGSMGGYKNTLRNAFALFGGFGLGYTAAYEIKNQFNQVRGFEKEIAGIQGVLGSKNKFDAGNLASGIGKIATKYGADLVETAQAARVLAQSGYEAEQVIRELDSTMAAARGMGMTIEQVQNLQVAIHATTAENENFNRSINYTSAVLDKISEVEARYAVEGHDLAEALTIVGPLAEQFGKQMTGVGDSFDYVIGLSTVLVERLRITGTQSGNVVKILLARLARPEVLNKLQKGFGVELADKATGDYLPLDRLVAELGQKYQELGKGPDGGARQKQLASLLGGGRQVNSIIALLENYTRVQQIATEASQTFGDTQVRSAIGMQTMDAAVGRVRASITLFTKNLFDATGFASGLKDILNTIASLLSGIGGKGGGLGTLVTLILGGGAAFQAGKGIFGFLKAAATLGGAGAIAKVAGEAKGLFTVFGGATTVTGRLAGVLGLLGRLFTPGGILITGITAAVAAWGYFHHRADEAREALEKYKVTLRDVKDIGLDSSPQYQNYKTLAEDPRFKLGTVENAQNVALRALTGGSKDGLRSEFADLQSILDDFQRNASNGTEATWAKKNVDSIRKFQTEFVKIFVDNLPEAQRKGFESIKDAGDRTAEVVKYISGAAFSATYQMTAAIEDLNAATKRMFDDTIKNLQNLDEESKKNDFFHRMFKTAGASDAFAGGNYAQVLGQVYKSDPLITAFLGNKTLRAAADKAGAAELDRQQGLGKRATNADLLAAFLEAISSDKFLSGIAGAVTAQQTGNVAALKQFSDVVLSAAGIDKNRDPLLRSQTALEAIRGTVSQSVKETVAQNNPALTALANLPKIFGFAQPGATKSITTGLTTAGEGLIQFKDKLLDVVLELYKSVQRFKQDQAFSARFGTAFNPETQIQEIAKRMFETFDNTATDFTAEIEQLYRKAETNRGSSGLKGEAKADAQIAAQREELKKDMTRFLTDTIPAVLGTSDAGQTIAKSLKEFFDQVASGVVEFNKDSFRAALERAGGAAFSESRNRQFRGQRTLQNLEIDRSFLAKRQEVAEAELSVTAKLGDKLALRQHYSALSLQSELKILEVRAKQEGMDQQQVTLAAQKLATEYKLGEALNARLDAAKAEQALQQQTVENLRGMTTGFKNFFTNTSIWEQILNPEGDDAESRAQAKAQAVAQVIFDTFGSVSGTIIDRIAENMQDTLVKSLFNSDFFNNLAGLGETGLKQDVWQTNAAEMTEVWNTDLIATAHEMGEVWAQRLGLGAGNTTAQGTTGYGSTQGLVGGAKSLLSGKAGGVKLSPDQKKALRDQLLTGGGVLAGNVLGTVVGGGGKGAQFGSSLGSVGGAALAGKFLGKTLGSFAGPLGGIVGGTIGGAIFGGLFGGKKKPKDPVQKTLEAIERLQRETVTSIQSQTDALLKPENRFLNLPSNFNVPSYNPGFSGGAGVVGGPQFTHNGDQVVQIHVNGGNLAEVRKVVQDEVGDMLFNDRRGRSWGSPQR